MVIPRRHLSSDVLGLAAKDFEQLMTSVHAVGRQLKARLGNGAKVAMFIEGFEVDYAHVKLVPIADYSPNVQETYFDLEEEASYRPVYPGYVSSKRGPKGQHPVCLMNTPPKTTNDPFLHLRYTTLSTWSKDLLQITRTVFRACVRYFEEELDFCYAATPLTTGSVSSPMGLGSDSKPCTVFINGQKTYMADSMQFYLEHATRLHTKGAWYYNLSFRGEKEDRTHLSQFYHCETELPGGLEEAIRTAEGFIRALTSAMLTQHAAMLKTHFKGVAHLEQMRTTLEKGSLPRITYREAKVLLADCGDGCFEPIRAQMGSGDVVTETITRKGERLLIEKFGPVWITNFEHLSVPFYQAFDEDGTARNADLLMGIGETLGLGERHADMASLERALRMHEIPVEDYAWYADMRKFTPMQTSGWGCGIERLLMWVCQHNDIRDMQCIPAHVSSKI